MNKKKKKSKRAHQYEPKLKVRMKFIDVINAAVRKPEKKVKKK